MKCEYVMLCSHKSLDDVQKWFLVKNISTGGFKAISLSSGEKSMFNVFIESRYGYRPLWGKRVGTLEWLKMLRILNWNSFRQKSFSLNSFPNF